MQSRGINENQHNGIAKWDLERNPSGSCNQILPLKLVSPVVSISSGFFQSKTVRLNDVLGSLSDVFLWALPSHCSQGNFEHCRDFSDFLTHALLTLAGCFNRKSIKGSNNSIRYRSMELMCLSLEVPILVTSFTFTSSWLLVLDSRIHLRRSTMSENSPSLFLFISQQKEVLVKSQGRNTSFCSLCQQNKLLNKPQTPLSYFRFCLLVKDAVMVSHRTLPSF